MKGLYHTKLVVEGVVQGDMAVLVGMGCFGVYLVDCERGDDGNCNSTYMGEGDRHPSHSTYEVFKHLHLQWRTQHQVSMDNITNTGQGCSRLHPGSTRGSAHPDIQARPPAEWVERPVTPCLGLRVAWSVSIIQCSVVITTTDENQVIWLKVLVSSLLTNLA